MSCRWLKSGLYVVFVCRLIDLLLAAKEALKELLHTEWPFGWRQE
jgi:hypothetical protein